MSRIALSQSPAAVDYPVRDLEVCPGDRLLLYTDGVIEPANAEGEASGDSKLQQVLLGGAWRTG